MMAAQFIARARLERAPAIIRRIRAVDDGQVWDMGMADFSSSDLEKALVWALNHDSNIAVVIEDELAFRRS